jgi:hypothetical protein
VEGNGGIVRMGPGGSPQRRVSLNGARPVFAGDAVVFVRGDENAGPQRLILAEPNARSRPFGATAGRIGALEAAPHPSLIRYANSVSHFVKSGSSTGPTRKCSTQHVGAEPRSVSRQ